MSDKDLITTMFAIIDDCRWPELATVFDADCVYERPGFAPIVGVTSLQAFYAHHRPIERGVHRVDALIAEDASMCAVGSFDGVLRDGSPIQLRFSDFYCLRDHRVSWRRTFFFTPLA